MLPPRVRRLAAQVRNERLYPLLLAHGGPARRGLILNMVRRFNRSRRIDPEQARGRFTIATIWEADRRTEWIERRAKARDMFVYHIPRDVFLFAFRRFMRAYERDYSLGEFSIQKYYRDEHKASRERFRRHAREALGIVRAAFGFDVLLIPKLNDDIFVDIIMAARQAGLPMVVHDREQANTPQRIDFYPPILSAYIDDMVVDRLCVSNEEHRQFFERSGYPLERMVMTGRPDSDYWSFPEVWQARNAVHPALQPDKHWVVFFSFGRSNYLNFYFPDECRDWTPLIHDCSAVLLDFLRRHRDRVQLVYKIGTKPDRDSYPGFHEFRAAVDRECGPNAMVCLDGSYNSLDLVRMARAVVGFQTTGLYEAMFTENPIIYAAWGDLYECVKDRLLPLHRTEAVVHARSKEQLLAALEHAIGRQADGGLKASVREARRIAREHQYFRPDGHATDRLLDVLRDVGTGMRAGAGTMKDELSDRRAAE